MPSTENAYLHVITGGFNETKRKQVRQLFQATQDEEDEEPDTHDTSGYDVIVGVLEEIHAVGVKSFKIHHAVGILNIFGVVKIIESPFGMDEYVERALALMSIPRHNDTYTIPDQTKLEALRRQHCSEEREAARREAMGIAPADPTAALAGSSDFRSMTPPKG